LTPVANCDFLALNGNLPTKSIALFVLEMRLEFDDLTDLIWSREFCLSEQGTDIDRGDPTEERSFPE